MSLINRLSVRLQNHPKRVVYPEGTDPRIIQAARQYATRGLGVPILLGDRTRIKINAARLDIKLDGVKIIEPARSDELEDFMTKFQGLRRFRNLDKQSARDYVLNNNYFATLMLATGGADAIVSGATINASSALRPLFQIIPTQEGVQTASSMLILEKEDSRLGIDGALFMADCGVIPEPTSEQLADIACTTAGLAWHLTNERPRVAMLAFSSKANKDKHASIARMKAATSLAKDKARDHDMPVEIDGELQADAALDPFVAEQKEIGGSVAGQANVLVFPDLNSGNIASKLAQIVSGARSYGQIITGLSKPAAEISRGASAHDIFGATVIVAAQAVDKKYLYPTD
ncbi:phosphate acetyltransferase [Ruficoccus amylovorans]|uniref:Phosphate acetyltransferase n=1 Tax=Ruficoccus amylovorans TaxID=1804625 RepID=A0A842HES7_9BACT|nr:phosphate acyltransferase [Ruficoccus amylovorans]MBC2594759.1 phosphate acetyltransferase [Ruficoccus amylovorans]